MITINHLHSFPLSDVLFVFALQSEASDVFDHCHTLITGLGKVCATYTLTQYLQQHRPALIVNLGSAGSTSFPRGALVCCTEFVQRDMDVRGLGYALYETPFSPFPIILKHGLAMDHLPLGICGTGDSFEMGHSETIYNLVDMEAYALAHVALMENIPFLSIKYISDGADDNAADDWTVQVHQAAKAYGQVLGMLT